MTFFKEMKKVELTVQMNINTLILTDIVFLTMAAVLCGEKGCKSVQILVQSKIYW